MLERHRSPQQKEGGNPQVPRKLYQIDCYFHLIPVPGLLGVQKQIKKLYGTRSMLSAEMTDSHSLSSSTFPF
jgi:hypothetical protein